MQVKTRDTNSTKRYILRFKFFTAISLPPLILCHLQLQVRYSHCYQKILADWEWNYQLTCWCVYRLMRLHIFILLPFWSWCQSKSPYWMKEYRASVWKHKTYDVSAVIMTSNFWFKSGLDSGCKCTSLHQARAELTTGPIQAVVSMAPSYAWRNHAQGTTVGTERERTSL